MRFNQYYKLLAHLTILISTIILLFTACSSNNEDQIIGKWKNENGNLVEFCADGVVTGLTKNVDKESVEGSFTIKDDSLFIAFIVTNKQKEIKGSLDFLIIKCDKDSLILATDLGNLNYWRTTPKL